MMLRIKDISTKVGSGVTPRGGAEVYQDHGVPLYRSQNVTDDGFLLDDIAYISEDIDASMSGTRIKPGDVLLNITGASIGRCYYTSPDFKRGNVNQHVCIIRPIQKLVLSSYLHLLLISNQGKEYIKLSQTGSGREGLTREEIRQFSFDIPSLPVQRRIVSYLDSKTSEIDQAISLLEQKREAYTRLKASVINRAVTRGLNPNVKLKDSGVEWIGKIPEGWKVLRGKDIGEITHGVSFTPNDLQDEGIGVLILRASNIQDNHLDFHDTVYIPQSLIPYKKMLKVNDIVICSTNGSLELVGKSTLIDQKLYASYGSFMLRLRTTQNPKFIQYQLTRIVDMYRGLFATTTINQLTISQLSNIKFFVPPLSEQRSIASYLDAECSKIDRAASIVEKQIDAYKRLKRSLINEVVTGKRKVE